MAPTRDRDENGTPILIPSSPSSPRRSRRLKRQRPQNSGLAGCPPPPPDLQAVMAARTDQWVRGGGQAKTDTAKLTIADIRALPAGPLGGTLAPQHITNIAKPSEATKQSDAAGQSDAANQSANIGSIGRPRNHTKETRVPRIGDAVLTGRVEKRYETDVYGLPLKRKNPFARDWRPARTELPVQTLPFAVKHAILSNTQKILEEALFYWTKKWLPEALRERGWESPEALEMNCYCAVINLGRIPENAFNRKSGLGKWNLLNFMKTRLHNIRHHAVHRLETAISILEEMLTNAQLLTDGLRDLSRTAKLRALAVALQVRDVKSIQAVIARPLSSFIDAIDLDALETDTMQSTPAAMPQQENIRSGNDATLGITDLSAFSQKENFRSGNGEHIEGRAPLQSASGYKGSHDTSSDSIVGRFEGGGNIGQSQYNFLHNLKTLSTNSPVREEGSSVHKELAASVGIFKDLQGSATVKSELNNHQAGIIKYGGGCIDLTMDSDDEDPKPVKLPRFINLTEDDAAPLFSSSRDTHMDG